MAHVHPGIPQRGFPPVQGVAWGGPGPQQTGFRPVPGGGPLGSFGPGPDKLAGSPPYVRNDFITKVYGILLAQLLTTALISVYILKLAPDGWMKGNAPLLYIVSLATLFSMTAVQCCCPSLLRTFPINYLILFAFTVGMSLIVAMYTSAFASSSALLALAATAGVFLCLTAYACLTKSDFTGMGPYLFAAVVSLCLFGLFLAISSRFFGLHAPILQTLYSCAGVLLFSLYIVYDTQLILGGAHRQQQFGVDDYCFAALSLYLDIINLFMNLLNLVGERQ